MRGIFGFFLIFTLTHTFGQCDMEIAGFDPATLEMSIVVHDGYCGSAADSIGEFLLTLTFDPPIPADENPFFCFSNEGDTDLLFPLNFPFVDIGEGEDNILQGGDTITFNLIDSQPLGLGTTLCWQEAINSGAFDSCIVLFINQINDSETFDGDGTGLGGFEYPDDNPEDNILEFSLTDACGGLPPPPITYGCTDPDALNFNPEATDDDGSCEYPVLGCTDPDALNFNPEATDDDGSCLYPIEGCTDPDALNYNPEASIDDGSCLYPEPIDAECPDHTIFVPNTFTPNNDGINDVFKVITDADCFLEWSTTIFNRWGNVVWQTNDPDEIWQGESRDGTHYVADGVYIYKIEAKGVLPSATQSLQGHLTIFR